MILIWDFNGTLLDDVQLGIDAINVLLARRDLPILESREAYQRHFRFPIIDYYADLGLDVSQYDSLAWEWMKEYLARVPDAPLMPHAMDMLEEARKQGIPQVLLSATEQSQLEMQVDQLGIAPYFRAILGQSDIYAASKVDRAKAYFAGRDEKLLLVGDTDHDFQTAKAIGSDCILCAAGHQSRAQLEQLGATVIDDLSGLLSYLEGERVLL